MHSDKKSILSLLAHLPDTQPIAMYSDDKWVYPLDLPKTLRNQGECKMLDVMFQVEKKKGIVIHIPNVTVDDLVDYICEKRKV